LSYYKNKIIIITGATSGVGKSLATFLHKMGADLILLGRDFSSLEKVLPECKPSFFKVSLENDKQIEEFVTQISSNYDNIDTLIHSAGLFHSGSIESMPVEKLDELYRINTRAPYLLTQKLLPLIKKRGGQVVFLNSTAVLQTKEAVGQYCASKSALKSIADSLRLELRADGINVMSVFLGATATPMQEQVQSSIGKTFDPGNFMQADEIAERILLVMQSGKTAGVTDVTIRDHISVKN
jgi:short-subunit dehydrogenase